MPKVMYKLWIEWNLGQDHFVFKSEKAAKRWFKAIRKQCNVDKTYKQLEYTGLLTLNEVIVYE
jgi:hypothetical protein